MAVQQIALHSGLVVYLKQSLSLIGSHSMVFRLVAQATLRQELGWFDTSNPNEVSSRIAGDTVVIEAGMGQKLGDLYVSPYVFGERRHGMA